MRQDINCQAKLSFNEAQTVANILEEERIKLSFKVSSQSVNKMSHLQNRAHKRKLTSLVAHRKIQTIGDGRSSTFASLTYRQLRIIYCDENFLEINIQTVIYCLSV